MNKKILKVKTPEGNYQIIVGHNTILNLGTYIKPVLKNKRVFIITGRTIIKIYRKKLLNIFCQVP